MFKLLLISITIVYSRDKLYYYITCVESANNNISITANCSFSDDFFRAKLSTAMILLP